jgi:tetratricopeptide (TPR) repeat protein
MEPVPTVIDGTVFLSVKVLPPSGGTEYLPIAQTTPIAQIGGSVFVYRGRFEVPLLAALSHTRRAQQLVRRARFEDAVADARKAVELAPEDPRTHFWLGMALGNAKQTDEARRELGTALELGQKRQEYLPSARVAKWLGDVDDFPALRSRVQRELTRLE